MKKINLLTGSSLCLALFSVHAAHAESFSPGVSGEVSFELQNDWTYNADDPDAEVNTLYTTIEPDLTLSLTDKLALKTHLVFEPVQATDPGDDTAFDNEGLYAEELKITYGDDHYNLFAGKYNPTFGSAWDAAPGVYGTDFAEDYETTERIGFGGSYTLGEDKTGEYTFTANTFFLDTSALSNSAVTKRGRTRLSDGGSSNTHSLSSFSVTVDGENAGGIDGLNLNVGYRNQAPGDADTGFDREAGYVAGANYTFPVSEAVEAMVLGEWVGIHHLDGTDDDIDYLTLSSQLTI